MNIRSVRQHGAQAIVLSIALSVAACSSAPKPTEELASARTAIDVARQAGAPSDSSMAFAQAREFLTAAETHLEREEHMKARRMAERARAKAEQARAEAEFAKTEAAATEVEEGLSVLRQQLK